MRKWGLLNTAVVIALAGCGKVTTGTESENLSKDAGPLLDGPSVPQFESSLRKTGDLFTRATEKRGSLLVREGNYYVDTKIQPWSGSWYPITDRNLFEGTDSPLAKYDRYVEKRHGEKSHASKFEENNIFHPEAPLWAGRCNAWALASVLVPAEKIIRTVTQEGITFSSADLMALATLSFDILEDTEQFGQRNDGTFDSVSEDIYPDQFHKILQSELYEKNRPFIMDKNSGVEVWHTPVFKSEVSILADQVNPSIYHVHAAIKGGLPLNPSEVIEKPVKNSVLIEYFYDLYGYPKWNGEFQVEYGVWTGPSMKNHPDFVWTIPEKVSHKSRNTEIKTEYVLELIDFK